MRKLITLLMIGFVGVSVWGQTEVKYRKIYTNISEDSNTDDLADTDRAGTVAYELDGDPSGGGLSSENFQVLDIGRSARRFQLVRNWTLNELYFRATLGSNELTDFSRIWHSGNSNASDKNWKCLNLDVSGIGSLKDLSVNGINYKNWIVKKSCYFSIGGDANTDDLADTDRAGTVAYELDGDPSGGGLSSENFQVLDIGRSARRFQLVRNWTLNELYFRATLGNKGFTDFSRIWHSGNSNSTSMDWSCKNLLACGLIKGKEVVVEEFSCQNGVFDEILAANNITIKANGNTADFVFEPDYQLKDLSEVETFIKTNKHLENIPSATQMEEQGVNLAEMNKLLLQKIEELTLYAIEKDKEMQEIKEAREKEQRERVKLEERMVRLENLLLKDER